VQCRELQTHPDSGFVRTTVCERFTPDGLVMLRGATLTEVTAGGVTERVLRDAGEYAATLRDRFGLDLPVAAAELWPRVWSSHLARQADQAVLVETSSTGAGRGPRLRSAWDVRSRVSSCRRAGVSPRAPAAID
jgi:hypothetical protein